MKNTIVGIDGAIVFAGTTINYESESESELSQFGQKPLATIANPGYYSPHIAMSARQLTTKFTATWLWSTTVGRLSGIPGGGLCRRADLNWEPQCSQPNTLTTTPLLLKIIQYTQSTKHKHNRRG